MLTIALGVAAGIVLGVLALLLLAHSVARQRVIHAWDSHLRTYKTPLVAQGLSEPTAERRSTPGTQPWQEGRPGQTSPRP